MKFLEKFAEHIKTEKEKDLRKYLLFIITGMFITTIIITSIIHKKNIELVTKMKTLDRLIIKTNHIIANNDAIEKKEQAIKKLIQDNKTFDIREYFEKFCKDQKIKIPLEDWDSRTQPVEGSDEFDEVVLEANFKGQTTEKLIHIIKELNKTKMIYIKALELENTDKKTINIDITIAAKKLKGI
jgi:hypothetical protein